MVQARLPTLYVKRPVLSEPFLTGLASPEPFLTGLASPASPNVEQRLSECALYGEEMAGLASPGAEPKNAARASVAGAAVSVATTCIGGGLLALPFAFASVGVGLGLLLLMASAVWSALSSHLLCRCCDWSGAYSYQEVCAAALGRRGAMALEVIMVWLLLGVMTSLLVITGDSLVYIAGALTSALWPRAPLLALDVLCVILPLSLAPSVNALVYSNAIALFCTCLVGASLMVRGVAVGDEAVLSEWPAFMLTPQVLRALPIIMLSFCCQVQIPGIYGGLRRRSMKRMDRSLAAAGAMTSLIYAAVAVFGLMALSGTGGSVVLSAHAEPGVMMFGHASSGVLPPCFTTSEPCTQATRLSSSVWHTAVPGNVLDGFPLGDTAALCMHAAMAIAATLVYPLLCVPCRSAVLHLAGKTTGVSGATGRQAALTAAMAALTATLAQVMPNLAEVMGITGATAGALICYILPPTFYLRLRGAQPEYEKDATKREALACTLGLMVVAPVLLAAAVSSCYATAMG